MLRRLGKSWMRANHSFSLERMYQRGWNNRQDTKQGQRESMCGSSLACVSSSILAKEHNQSNRSNERMISANEVFRPSDRIQSATQYRHDRGKKKSERLSCVLLFSFHFIFLSLSFHNTQLSSSFLLSSPLSEYKTGYGHTCHHHNLSPSKTTKPFSFPVQKSKPKLSAFSPSFCVCSSPCKWIDLSPRWKWRKEQIRPKENKTPSGSKHKSKPKKIFEKEREEGERKKPAQQHTKSWEERDRKTLWLLKREQVNNTLLTQLEVCLSLSSLPKEKPKRENVHHHHHQHRHY